MDRWAREANLRLGPSECSQEAKRFKAFDGKSTNQAAAFKFLEESIKYLPLAFKWLAKWSRQGKLR